MHHWQQPPGLWREKNATLPLCLAGLGLDPGFFPEDEDSQGAHLWHYWAASPFPEKTFDRLACFPEILRTRPDHAGIRALECLVLRGCVSALGKWEKTWPADWAGAGAGILLAAAWSGNGRVLRQVLRLVDAPVDQRGPDGMTPLMVAIHRHIPDDWAALVEAGASPDITDDRGRMALHHVAEYGDLGAFHLLEAAGADPEAMGLDGQTPEMLFARAEAKPPGAAAALRRRWEQRYRTLLLF